MRAGADTLNVGQNGNVAILASKLAEEVYTLADVVSAGRVRVQRTNSIPRDWRHPPVDQYTGYTLGLSRVAKRGLPPDLLIL